MKIGLALSLFLLFVLFQESQSYFPHAFTASFVRSRQGPLARLFASTEGNGAAGTTSTKTTPTTGSSSPPLTQKEYYIALRNRLYTIDEQIWLYDYVKSHYRTAATQKLPSYSEEKYEALLSLRQQLLQEYPLTKLYVDLQEAIHYNLTYASNHIDNLITSIQRQLPMPLQHINQIAVTSFSGKVMNLLHSQGSIYQRLLPSSISLPNWLKRQFQHPTFSSTGKYIAFVEFYFEVQDTSNVRFSSSSAASGASATSTTTSATTSATSNSNSGSKDKFAKAHILVYNVENNPKDYGNQDLTPIYDSGPLPNAPFFIRFSPNDEQLVLLSTDMNETSSTYGDVSIAMLDWKKFYSDDPTVQERIRELRANSQLNRQLTSALTRPIGRTLLRGNSIGFSFTTSCSKNATIVAHVERKPGSTATNPTTSTSKTNKEKGVWLLQRSDTSGVNDFQWIQINHDKQGETAKDEVAIRWGTPQCHSAGGGDNVILIENGYLVSKALSRYKRYAMIQKDPNLLQASANEENNGAGNWFPSKKLKAVRGQVHFLVSPDHSRLVILEEDFHIGHYSLVTVDGEQYLDPLNPAVPSFPDSPTSIGDRLIIAYWFSPDSTKLLCLTSANRKLSDMIREKNGFSVGLNAPMTWFVYNFPLKEWKEYDTFQPTPYFMKTYVPFFSLYAQTFNPWAPDSRSFIYMTDAGLCHTPLLLAGNGTAFSTKYCLGMDKWQNQGATFGTWSRH